jgi:cytochrome oxidase Cu insertion factor (SCO1/SenC/PrrC family)
MARIRNVTLAGILGALMTLFSVSSILAVEVGQPAPDFDLDSSKGGKLKLSSLRGKTVLINFYGRDYDPT